MNNILDNISFFDGFSGEDKERLSLADNLFKSYEPGDLIIEEGAPDDSLKIIIQGSANVTKKIRPDFVLSKMNQGAVMGELSFLTTRPRSTNVTAETKVICFSISSMVMQSEDFEFKNKIKDKLIEILIKRLDEKDKTLMGVALDIQAKPR